MAMKNSQRTGITLLELLVVIAIIAVLTALLVPAVQRVRNMGQRATCRNRLRQVVLAVHNYHNVHGCFPAGCSYRDADEPFPHMSWLTRLLPYVEKTDLWQQALAAYAADRFFETQPHFPVLGNVVATFVCPTDTRSQQAWRYLAFSVAFTDYLGVEGSDLRRMDGVLYLNSKIRLADVLDGASSTLLAGERPPSLDNSLGWWYAGWGQEKTGSAEMVLGVREIRVHPRYLSCPSGPYTFQIDPLGNQCDLFHFWSFHPGGAHFAFCDGSVRFLAYSADPIMPALASRAGGEAVAVPD